jgi:hypothetical protein
MEQCQEVKVKFDIMVHENLGRTRLSGCGQETNGFGAEAHTPLPADNIGHRTPDRNELARRHGLDYEREFVERQK